MSRDEKIRDLMRRLTAMSPEPPPFPEEMPMARHEAEEKRANPVLVFAAAVAAVAALAVPLFLFVGGGEPDAVATTTTTSTIPPSTAPAETTTTTTPTTTTTTTAVPTVESWEGVVYLYQEPVDSFVGNPALVPVLVSIDGPFPEDADFSEALAQVGGSLPEGFFNAIPSDVTVVSQSTDGSVLTADMSGAFVDGAGGLLADFTMLNQLIFTLTHQGLDDLRVVFTVNGEPVETFGTEGLDLTEPVGRDSFLDQIHMINLTSPVVAHQDGYTVQGIANVFEATVSIAVLDGAGEVVHEEFVTATCGTGCWGEFSTSIDTDLVVPGESSIRLFTHSPEDGSVVEAITVAIPEGDVWDLTSGS